ncbi:hypothetical protein WAE58_21725 [Pedobacter panaciterrae]|uniref:Uncharacterized protein n=1 Tax=Pedobacter panaciterrae TaxID=363849 RepID=A0ABU8NUK0_9SPHI
MVFTFTLTTTLLAVLLTFSVKGWYIGDSQLKKSATRERYGIEDTDAVWDRLRDAGWMD